MKKIKVEVVLLAEGIKLPVYATEGAACFDLAAAKDHTIFAQTTKVVGTGLRISVPPGSKMSIRPRSGISLKTPFRVANAPGTIDSDYRGEVGIIMTNTANVDMNIEAGDRIAQGCIEDVIQAEFKVVDELSETERGEGGYGSTGVS